MARMNISVPDDVKSRMDAAEEPVNWSAVASRAFEIELGEIAKRKQEKDMSDVIARLRASKLENTDEEYKTGQAYGRQWAEQAAEYAELKRLAVADESRSRDNWDWDGRSIVKAATDNEQDEVGYIWEDELPPDSEDYFNGFVDGAVEVFEEVADKI